MEIAGEGAGRRTLVLIYGLAVEQCETHSGTDVSCELSGPPYLSGLQRPVA